MNLKEKIDAVKLEIVKAAKQCDRDPFKIKLVAVTKTVSHHIVSEAINLGITDIGESYINEAIEKFPQIKNLKKAKTHFIGHLQSNKAKKAVQLFDVIHSVDSKKLARKLSHYCIEYNKIIDVLIEVNLSKEETKFGVKEEELNDLVNEINNLKNLNLIGLMTIAPEIEPELTRPYFRRLNQLAQKYKIQELSMGMTNDYAIAIEEGSTIVRIGTAIFGKREIENQ